MSGRFISLEGADGSGKSTQARLLAAALRDRGRTVVETREPGGTPLGERVRDLLLGDVAIDPVSEALLFAAARAQHVREVIRPTTARGDWVICDRFVDSSVAYQGAARDLGVDMVQAINRPAVDGVLPDLTILLDVPVEVAVARRQGDADDRIEAEGAAFQIRVADAFRALAAQNPDRFVVVPGNRDVDEVHRAIMDAVEKIG